MSFFKNLHILLCKRILYNFNSTQQKRKIQILYLQEISQHLKTIATKKMEKNIIYLTQWQKISISKHLQILL